LGSLWADGAQRYGSWWRGILGVWS